MNNSSNDKPAATPAQTGAKSRVDNDGEEIHGEGNYTAARRFRESEEQFAARNKQKIPDMAKDAEKAIDGPEGDELRRAEDRARSHAAGPKEH
jgi:hypothetical protein